MSSDVSVPSSSSTAGEFPHVPLDVEAGPSAEQTSGREASLWSDAWRQLRRNPQFVIAAIIIVFYVFFAVVGAKCYGQNTHSLTCQILNLLLDMVDTFLRKFMILMIGQKNVGTLCH